MNISVLVPFDIGESYVFKVASHRCARCVWANIFDHENERAGRREWEWNTDLLGEAPTFYREPFGSIARLKRTGPVDTLRDLAQDGISCIGTFDHLEVIFFARGIGILMLRGKMKEKITSADWRKCFYTMRGRLKEALKNILVEAQVAYTAVRNHRATDRSYTRDRCIFRVKDLPSRRRVIDEARFPYAIAYTLDTVPGFDRDGPASISNPRPLRYKHPNPDCQDHPCIDVGWGETTVYCSGDLGSVQGAIENAFVAAMASWFSLIVMGSLVSEFMRDSFIDLSAPRQRLNDEKGQVIRLAFLDAANASRPVRWTFRERDILLLDRIHETWSSKRLWRSIEERTTLLAAHHNEVATEIRRRSERRIATIGIVLTATTVISAVQDFSEAGTWTRLAMLAIGLVATLGFLILWAVSGHEESL